MIARNMKNLNEWNSPENQHLIRWLPRWSEQPPNIQPQRIWIVEYSHWIMNRSETKCEETEEKTTTITTTLKSKVTWSLQICWRTRMKLKWLYHKVWLSIGNRLPQLKKWIMCVQYDHEFGLWIIVQYIKFSKLQTIRTRHPIRLN